MPLPFLIFGLGSLFLGGVGAAAASDAMDIYKRAEKLANDAKDSLDEKVQDFEFSQYSFSEKIEALNGIITKIDKTILPKLKTLTNQIEQKGELKLEYVGLNKQLYNVLQDRNANITVSNNFFDAVSSIATGAAVSTFTPTLLVSLATTIGTASTGTAISTLSGVAANNAALAWLGGGALSAGGMGMSGGLLMTNIATVGVGILIGGIVLNVKAEKALTEAKEYSSKVDLEIKKINGYMKKIEILEDKVEYQIYNSERNFELMSSFIKGINRQNMTKADVRRVMNAIVIFNKYRETLMISMTDKKLDRIMAVCDKKLNEAQSIIESLKN